MYGKKFLENYIFNNVLIYLNILNKFQKEIFFDNTYKLEVKKS